MFQSYQGQNIFSEQLEVSFLFHLSTLMSYGIFVSLLPLISHNLTLFFHFKSQKSSKACNITRTFIGL